jgi:tetratricopeptide (TPR) repeat protein
MRSNAICFRTGLLALSMMVTACAAGTRSAEPAADDPGPLQFFALEGRVMQFVHLEPSPDMRLGGRAVAGERMGTIMAFPTSYSSMNHAAVLRAQRMYDMGNFAGAVHEMEKPVMMEPRNPFILNEIARALYQTDRERSYEYYERLIDVLDTQPVGAVGTLTPPPGGKRYPAVDQHGAEVDTVRIDMWFLDAYWKYGTLLLDREEYRHAVFEISRAVSTRWEAAPEALLDQACTWLAEAWLEIGEAEAARHYALWALRVHPGSPTARNYLRRAEEMLAPPPD